jgi:hypothetical protein
MKNEQVVQVIDLSLAALGVLPSVIHSIEELIALRRRVQSGQDVTEVELTEALDRIKARSARIQAA